MSSMESELSHLRTVPLPRPARGQSARFRIGRLQLVLEPTRGGFALLCLDGSDVRTWSLGLPRDGELLLVCRTPRWPLQLALKDTLVLVPGGRVRGFVQVALVPTVLWRTPDGSDEVVAEILPAVLSAEWDEVRSTCVQRCTSPFFQRLPPPTLEVRAVLPLAIRNDGQRMQSPATLPLSLHDRELRVCRGHLVAAPRRLRFADDGGIATQVRNGAWWGSR